MSVLVSAGRPVTVAELRTLAPSLRQSSTYRNLTLLRAAGLVAEVTTTDGILRFELADPPGTHHHHLRCTSCGEVTNIEMPDDVERAIKREALRWREERAFQTASHLLELEGLCPRCAGIPD